VPSARDSYPTARRAVAGATSALRALAEVLICGQQAARVFPDDLRPRAVPRSARFAPGIPGQLQAQICADLHALTNLPAEGRGYCPHWDLGWRGIALAQMEVSCVYLPSIQYAIRVNGAGKPMILEHGDDQWLMWK
jgi:hypothetical protein